MRPEHLAAIAEQINALAELMKLELASQVGESPVIDNKDVAGAQLYAAFEKAWRDMRDEGYATAVSLDSLIELAATALRVGLDTVPGVEKERLFAVLKGDLHG